jgi:sugar phosphate permease
MLFLLAVLSSIVPLALLVPSLYGHLWLLAAILFATNGGQAIASLIIVLVPAESAPAGFAGTAIGLVTLVGEIIGATAAPAAGGALAERFGLGTTLWLSTGGTLFLFLVTLLLKETSRLKAGAADPAR